jgi:hypothetical protein
MPRVSDARSRNPLPGQSSSLPRVSISKILCCAARKSRGWARDLARLRAQYMILSLSRGGTPGMFNIAHFWSNFARFTLVDSGGWIRHQTSRPCGDRLSGSFGDPSVAPGIYASVGPHFRSSVACDAFKGPLFRAMLNVPQLPGGRKTQSRTRLGLIGMNSVADRTELIFEIA